MPRYDVRRIHTTAALLVLFQRVGAHVACVGTLRGEVVEADVASLATDRCRRAHDQPYDGYLSAGKVGRCSAGAGKRGDGHGFLRCIVL